MLLTFIEHFMNHVTNEEVRSKIQAAIGEYDEFLTLVKQGKLRWFSRVSSFSGLAKMILHGTVKDRRKRGRKMYRNGLSQTSVRKLRSK